MKIHALLTTISALFMVSLLSGCILTDDFKESLVEEHNRGQKESLNEQTQAYRIQQLEKSIEELNQFKPQLVRVIQLENDLAYITGALKQGPSRLAVNADIESGVLSNSLNDVIEQTAQGLANDAMTENGRDMPPELQNLSVFEGSSKTSTVPKQNQNVEVRSAKPPLSISSLAEGSDEVIDAKFSSFNSADSELTKTAMNSSPVRMHSANVSQNKFSGERKQGVSDCARAKSIDGEFSVHLASYSSLDNAENGWKRLSEKHKSSICGLTPVLADVNVSGKNYLSLRVGPLRTVEDVSQLCNQIRASGDYCAPANYVGTPL